MNSSDKSGHSSTRGVTYVLAAALLFGINGTASKAVLNQALTPEQLVGLRCWFASGCFAVIALATGGSLRLRRDEVPLILAYGLVGVAMVQWLYFVSISRMPVSITLLIEFTAPVLIALWVRFVRHESVRARVWVALALTLVGLALVAQVWEGLTLDTVGLMASIGAAVALAVYYLLGEHGVGRRDPWSLAAWSFGTAGLLWALVVPIWRFPWRALGTTVELSSIGLSGPTWTFALYVAVAGTVLPFGLTLLGLREIGAARVGLLATAEPPLAGLIAWPVLGEVLTPVQLLGATIVLIGIILAETARSGSQRVTEPPPATETMAW